MISETIDCGDVVFHGTKGKTRLVAAVEDDRAYWFGFPFGGYAHLTDCSLVEKASESQRQYWLEKLAEMKNGARPCILARARLAKPVEAQS